MRKMALIFCPQCGSKAEYQFAPPNFCAKCGVSYQASPSKPANLLSKRLQKPSRLAAAAQDAEDDEEEFEDDEEGGTGGGSFYSDSNRVPRLRGLAVDLDHSSANRVMKIGDLIQEVEGSAAPQFNGFRPQRPRDINELSPTK
jgi:hypothetical protein